MAIDSGREIALNQPRQVLKYFDRISISQFGLDWVCFTPAYFPALLETAVSSGAPKRSHKHNLNLLSI